MVLYHYIQREGDLKIIRQPILLQALHTLSPSLWQAPSQYPHRSLVLQEHRGDRKFDITLKLVFSSLMASSEANNFVMLLTMGTAAPETPSEALLNSPLKPAQFFHEGEFVS